MKSFSVHFLPISIKAIAATVAVIAAMVGTFVGTRSGVISIEQLQRFWPLALVAVGFLDLLSWQEKKGS